MLKDRLGSLEGALKFLESSIDPETGGSRAFYSKLLYSLKGWSLPYPETTGYIIPSFVEASKHETQYLHFQDLAVKMADWIVEIQREDGALPGHLWTGKFQQASVFNSAQMLIGLKSAYDEIGLEKYQTAAIRNANWLVECQESDGSWSQHAYKDDFFPSYYTRVAWPLLEAGLQNELPHAINAAEKTLDLILKRVLPNHFVQESGFAPKSQAFLHTMVYTIRGFWEAFQLTGNHDYELAAKNWADALLKKFEIRRRLGGKYGEDFKPDESFRCLTGEAQLCIVWFKMALHYNDPRYVNAGLKLMDQLAEAQTGSVSMFFKTGGLTGSKPWWKDYIRFRQPNWAVKFYIDALLLEHRCMGEIDKKLGL